MPAERKPFQWSPNSKLGLANDCQPITQSSLGMVAEQRTNRGMRWRAYFFPFRHQEIEYDVSIVRDIRDREVRIFTDAGRCLRSRPSAAHAGRGALRWVGTPATRRALLQKKAVGHLGTLTRHALND